MKTYLLSLSVVLLLSGCMSFVDTLGTVQSAVIEARGTFQPVIDSWCGQLARDCANQKQVVLSDNPAASQACDLFEVCDGFRAHVIHTFEMINMIIADANMSYAIGDEEGADAAISKALALIEQLREQMRQLGYLK